MQHLFVNSKRLMNNDNNSYRNVRAIKTLFACKLKFLDKNSACKRHLYYMRHLILSRFLRCIFLSFPTSLVLYLHLDN